MKMFVYGTLKRGYGNNRYLETAQFLGEAISTEARFHMCGFGIPFLMDGGTRMVKGELWEVPEEALPPIDRLESGYKRREHEFLNSTTREITTAWVYLLEGASYGEDQDAEILEWPFNESQRRVQNYLNTGTNEGSRISPGFERVRRHGNYESMIEDTLRQQKEALEYAGQSRRRQSEDEKKQGLPPKKAIKGKTKRHLP